MKKLIYTHLIILCIINPAFSQKRLDLFVEVGVSNRTFENQYNLTYDTYYQPTFRSGVDFHKTTKHNFIFGSKLFLSYIQTKTDRSITQFNNSKIENSVIEDQFLIGGINPYFGLKIKKFSINLGILIMDNILFKSTINGEIYGVSHDNTSTKQYLTRGNTYRIISGLSSSISYQLNDKFTLEASCLKSTNHGQQYYGEDLNLKLYQLNFGFKFNIFNFKKKETIKPEPL